MASQTSHAIKIPQTHTRELRLATRQLSASKGKTKMAFIAGPYLGDGSYLTIYNNIAEAERVAVQLANRRVHFFCPHTHTKFFGNKSNAPESFYKEMDIKFLSFCDFLVATPRWKQSSGAREEVKQCISAKKLVFYLDSLDDADTYNEIEKYAKGGNQ